MAQTSPHASNVALLSAEIAAIVPVAVTLSAENRSVSTQYERAALHVIDARTRERSVPEPSTAPGR